MQAAGQELQIDLSLNQTGGVDDDADPSASLTVASYRVPPYPANEPNANCMVDVLMKIIGLNLTCITTSDRSQCDQYVAQLALMQALYAAVQ